MHESSLMKGLMKQILTQMDAHQGRRVTGVQITLGALVNMTPSHLNEHFTEAAAGTPAENARLDITVADNPADPHALDITITGVEVEQ